VIVTRGGTARCRGGSTTGLCMNDHLAWLPRSNAASYFSMASELETCYDAKLFLKHHISMGGTFLHERLVESNVSVAPSRLVPYTLARPCDTFSDDLRATAECHRLTFDLNKHPGGLKLAALKSTSEWRAKAFSTCVERWPWPRGVAGPIVGGSAPPKFLRVC
jgi:hypothetical protein